MIDILPLLYPKQNPQESPERLTTHTAVLSAEQLISSCK